MSDQELTDIQIWDRAWCTALLSLHIEDMNKVLGPIVKTTMPSMEMRNGQWMEVVCAICSRREAGRILMHVVEIYNKPNPMLEPRPDFLPTEEVPSCAPATRE